MKNVLFPLALVCFSSLSYAQNIDMEATMKKMALAYKSAVQAESLQEVKAQMVTLDALVEKSKRAQFAAEKKGTYLEGLNKLSDAIDEVNVRVEAQQLEQAKESLKQINDLRKEYHDKRNPSIWQRLFG